MESNKNEAGKYLMCFVTDGEGKKHKKFIPEGRGLIGGWHLLVEKLRELGIKGDGSREKSRKRKGIFL